ncbi:unnamed protein product [Trypanosoma congolense IL3000]|uniref:WGS project CAEQ00000000 data, annotated contig 1640 n=1 Tax=Trypanosoma congolense (strain IL3000) TaxID=1068625 RepID=F9W7Q2_TRYCI|nr:unnamed protein product [Trypanosoma congolense IL3000]
MTLRCALLLNAIRRCGQRRMMSCGFPTLAPYGTTRGETASTLWGGGDRGCANASLLRVEDMFGECGSSGSDLCDDDSTASGYCLDDDSGDIVSAFNINNTGAVAAGTPGLGLEAVMSAAVEGAVERSSEGGSADGADDISEGAYDEGLYGEIKASSGEKLSSEEVVDDDADNGFIFNEAQDDDDEVALGFNGDGVDDEAGLLEGLPPAAYEATSPVLFFRAVSPDAVPRVATVFDNAAAEGVELETVGDAMPSPERI